MALQAFPDPEAFINSAIDRGAREGLDALEPLQQTVFLISEVEVYSDMGGIDAFVDAYGPTGLRRASEAFLAVGATEIAAALVAMARGLPGVDENLWNRANALTTARTGYNFDAIAACVQARLANASAASP